MQKIGLLTGTFDPIHLGHIALAGAALRACALDEVWMMVNPDPTHKDSASVYADRMIMAELAVADVNGMAVYRGEHANEPHIISTFGAIQSEHPNLEFIYILGIDTFARLDGWDDVQSVVTNATYAVAHRPGTPGDVIAELKSRLGGLADQLKVHQFEFDDHGMASSSEIRRRVSKGERPASLDGRVYDFIVSRGLYGAS